MLGIFTPNVERTVAREFCDQLRNEEKPLELFNGVISNLKDKKLVKALEEHRHHIIGMTKGKKC